MQLKIEDNIKLADGSGAVAMVFVEGKFLLISESSYTEDILKELKRAKVVKNAYKISMIEKRGDVKEGCFYHFQVYRHQESIRK